MCWKKIFKKPKKGIENVGRVKFKYKVRNIELEYEVQGMNLYFETSSFDFSEITKLIKERGSVYLSDKRIRCNVGSVLFSVDKDASVRKIKKQLEKVIIKYIEINVYQNPDFYYGK